MLIAVEVARWDRRHNVKRLPCAHAQLMACQKAREDRGQMTHRMTHERLGVTFIGCDLPVQTTAADAVGDRRQKIEMVLTRLAGLAPLMARSDQVEADQADTLPSPGRNEPSLLSTRSRLL